MLHKFIRPNRQVFALTWILFLVFAAGQVSAITIDSTKDFTNIDNVNVTGIDYGIIDATTIENQLKGPLETTMDTTFTTMLDEARNELSQYGNQEKMAKGFGEANAFASHAGSLQGYRNYDIFAIGFGLMAGVQAPSIDPDYYGDLDQKIKEQGDLYAGMGIGLSMLNVGLHGGFISHGLQDFYFNVKFASLSTDQAIAGSGEGSFSNTNIGFQVNYALVRSSASFLFGLAKWRGVSVGTGVLYNKMDLSFKPELEPIKETISETIDIGSGVFADVQGTMTLDPSALLSIKTQTVSVPLEIVTSVQALWVLNLTIGAGVDFITGKTDIIVSAKTDARLDATAKAQGTETKIADIEVKDYDLIVDGSTKGIKPGFVRPRLMLGIGFNFGPVKLDVPVIYYPASGAAVGLTAGIVW